MRALEIGVLAAVVGAAMAAAWLTLPAPPLQAEQAPGPGPGGATAPLAPLPAHAPPEPSGDPAPEGEVVNQPGPERQPALVPRRESLVVVAADGFEPAELAIPAGTLVVFRNEAEGAHEVQLRMAGQRRLLLDAPLNPGEEARVLLDAPGEYAMRCALHAQGWEGPETGTLTVMAGA